MVVTAGGTREPIDPVRYIGNRSSGKMGNALAAAAHEAGANVTLITTVPPQAANDMTVVAVETAADMRAAVNNALTPAAILIMAAAVADYTPASPQAKKIKKSEHTWALELTPTVDILAELGKDGRRNEWFVVGFAAETDDAVANGRAKVGAKNLDLCVINDVSKPGIGMGADDNEVIVVDQAGTVAEFGKASKTEIATHLLAVIAERYRSTRARA